MFTVHCTVIGNISLYSYRFEFPQGCQNIFHMQHKRIISMVASHFIDAGINLYDYYYVQSNLSYLASSQREGRQNVAA